MDTRETDISALAERLGMRGMRYRSFGNPPYRGTRRAAPAAAGPEGPAAAPAQSAPAPPGVPITAAFAQAPPPVASPPSWQPQPAAPAPPLPVFPLIAQALAAASGPAPSVAPGDRAEAVPPGTLPFLALRAAVRGAGG